MHFFIVILFLENMNVLFGFRQSYQQFAQMQYRMTVSEGKSRPDRIRWHKRKWIFLAKA